MMKVGNVLDLLLYTHDHGQAGNDRSRGPAGR